MIRITPSHSPLISNKPTLSKLLESHVGNWILNHVASKLDVKQFGTLRGWSTTHTLVDMLYKTLDQC